MALGAQRSNFMTVPTDCDQRDERLGWMGDANLSGDSMALNFNVKSFFKFYLKTIASEIDSDGSLTDTVPFYRYGSRPGDVSWTEAFVNLNYVMWTISNDDAASAQLHLDDMVRQLRNVQGQASQGLGKMHTPYGDWCPPPVKMGTGQGPKPSSPYTSAFSYLSMIRQVYEMALHLGNQSVVTECQVQKNFFFFLFFFTFRDTILSTVLTNFSQIFFIFFFPQALNVSVTKEFQQVFGHGPKNGCYDGCTTQTGLVLALALDMEGNVGEGPAATRALLVENIQEEHKTHYTTGIIGAKVCVF